VTAFGIRVVFAQQVGVADDGIHRRADFVAHVGHEGALGPARLFGFLLGRHQFRSALGNAALKQRTLGHQFSRLTL